MNAIHRNTPIFKHLLCVFTNIKANVRTFYFLTVQSSLFVLKADRGKQSLSKLTGSGQISARIRPERDPSKKWPDLDVRSGRSLFISVKKHYFIHSSVKSLISFTFQLTFDKKIKFKKFKVVCRIKNFGSESCFEIRIWPDPNHGVGDQ